MNAIQIQLEKATQAVNERLLGGFKNSEIPDIATMICGIETLSNYAQAFEHVPEEEPEGVEATAIEADEAAGIDYLLHAYEELADAETYYQYWLDTGEQIYKDLAADEVRHSEVFLGKAKAEYPDNEKLDELKTWHNAILARIV